MGFNPRSIRDLGESQIEVLHPQTKRPTGATITLAGPDHPKARAISMAAARKLRRQLEKTGKLQLEDPEAEEESRLDELCARTLAWTGMVDDGEVEMPCNAENVRKLYTGLTWLRLQMLEAMNDRGNFIAASAPS